MKKFALGICVGFSFMLLRCINLREQLQKKILKEKRIADLNYMLYHTMNSWFMLMQKGKSITEYFIENNFYDIAIYGMGNMGERLYDALEETDIHVKYGIDRNKDNIFTTLPVCKPEEELKEVDAVVVTAVYDFSDIEQVLRRKVNCPIISIEKVIEEVLQK